MGDMAITLLWLVDTVTLDAVPLGPGPAVNYQVSARLSGCFRDTGV